jgi:uncharacterized protein involved in exopolysaccharide biosynthesis/Mrp family chromosome partitioning ATPase
LIDRSGLDQEALTSQVQLVLSRELARAVIKQVNLTELPEFDAALRDQFSAGTVLRMIGLARDPLSMTLEERVLAAYYDRLTAYAIDKSRVIVIEFQSADPELAARIANAIAETYLTLQQVAKQDQARAAGQWLSGEIEKLRTTVSEAEAKAEAFRAKSNLFLGANNTSLSNQQLTELSTQISAARAQKADAETRARMIREQLRSGQPIEASDIVNSELIRRLSEQRVTLRAQLAEQSSTLLPQHPRIRELRAQIGDLDQQIKAEGEKLVRTLESDAKVAGARLDTLGTSLDQLKRQAASTSEQDVQLRALEREAKAQRDLFESYLAKYREASARDSIAAAPADARIISRAAVSNLPYFPKKVPIVLIATAATFALASAFVVMGALLDGSPYRGPLQIDTTPIDEGMERRAPRSSDARTRTTDRLPAAGKLPEPATAALPPPSRSPPPVLPATVDSVTADIQRAGEGGRRVALVGAARNVGTTLTTIALARALARNARVVIVDLAFASPNLDVISNDPAAPGIAELVRGAASFGDIITRDQSSRAHVVAAGRIEGDAQAVVSSHMFMAALDALAQSYEYLVVDAGAASEAAMASIARVVPRAILVAGDTAEAASAAVRDQLRTAGFHDIAVLTGPPPAFEQAAAGSAAA